MEIENGMNQSEKLNNLVTTALSMVRDEPKLGDSIGLVKYLFEMRCVDLRVPRQVGKSTYLHEMLKRGGCIYVAGPGFAYAKSLRHLFGLSKYIIVPHQEVELDVLRRFKSEEEHFDYILIDEPRYVEGEILYRIVQALYNRRLIDDKTIILGLGT